MISKCQNIVINRTKFSDFEEFHPETTSTEGLKLVGFIETTDLCTGETIKKNVSVDYPNTNSTIMRPENLLIEDLYGVTGNNIIPVTCVDGAENANIIRYTVTSNFGGDFIQINNLNAEDRANQYFGNGYFNIGFSKDIPFGRTFTVLLNNFPVNKYGIKLRQVSPTDNGNSIVSAGSGEILVEKYGDSDNVSILITFMQVTDKATSSISSGSSTLRKVVASEIQILN